MEISGSEDIISHIGIVGRLIHEKVAKQARNPISPTQVKIMSLIAQRGAPAMKEIAADLFITAPSATALIEELSATGAVRRYHDRADRRTIRLKLTDKGKRIVTRQRNIFKTAINGILDGLSDKERKQFETILKKIIKTHETN